MNDYIARLDNGTRAVNSAMVTMATTLLSAGKDQSQSKDDNTITVSVYNPLAWQRFEFVSVLLNYSNVVVYNSSGGWMPSQVNIVPSYSFDNANFKLFFLVDIPPLTLDYYTIQIINENEVRFF